ncbi:MAG: hypothetical protein RRA94_15310, partial [Bacteroidota bacterium]|nr:hypothetical protein [Bacteroidota bacterium]
MKDEYIALPEGLLSRIGTFAAREGVEAYVVGGFVRDQLLGRETTDIDIA